MKSKEFNEWLKLKNRLDKGEALGYEHQELIRLNHLVIEESHKIHNDNMLNGG